MKGPGTILEGRKPARVVGNHPRGSMPDDPPLSLGRLRGRRGAVASLDMDVDTCVQNSVGFVMCHMLLRLRRHDIGKAEKRGLFGHGDDF